MHAISPNNALTGSVLGFEPFFHGLTVCWRLVHLKILDGAAPYTTKIGLQVDVAIAGKLGPRLPTRIGICAVSLHRASSNDGRLICSPCSTRYVRALASNGCPLNIKAFKILANDSIPTRGEGMTITNFQLPGRVWRRSANNPAVN